MQGVDAGITTRRQRYGNMKIPIELGMLPAARIRTNPVSLNGGVERAPPAR